MDVEKRKSPEHNTVSKVSRVTAIGLYLRVAYLISAITN